MKRGLAAIRAFAKEQWPSLVALMLMAGLAIADVTPVDRLRIALFDIYERLLPRDRTSTPAVGVSIDDASLAKFGQWPWPRSLLGDLIGRIADGKPRVIALGIFFPEPDRSSPQYIAKVARGMPPDLIARLNGLPSNDEVLARAMRRAPVVLAVLDTDDRDYRFAAIKSRLSVDRSLTQEMVRITGQIESVAPIRTAAAGFGALNFVETSDDRVYRAAALVEIIGDTPVPALGLEALRLALASKLEVHADGLSLLALDLAGHQVKFQKNGLKWMRFGQFDTQRYVSAVDVLLGKVQPRYFQDKIVIVGVSATGLDTLLLTPLGEYVPSSEIQLQLIEQLVDGTPLYRPGWLLAGEVTLMLAWGLGLSVAVRSRSSGLAAVFLLGGLLALTALGIASYAEGLLVDVALPMMGGGVAFVVSLTHSLAIAKRARDQAVHLFSRFVNPQVVQRLLKDDAFARQGQSRELTLLFSDIRGFTALAERRSPGEVVFLLNEYFSRQVQGVFAHDGVLDKFIGDAMMVFWGAPLDDPDHARHAIECALGMVERLKQFREDLGMSDEEFDIGIGIHTGRAIVGLIGSEIRREYTAIGAAVNIASRVEGLTKEAHRRILVTRETMERCGDAFDFEFVGRFALKGVERLVEIYEPRRPPGET